MRTAVFNDARTQFGLEAVNDIYLGRFVDSHPETVKLSLNSDHLTDAGLAALARLPDLGHIF